MHENENKLIKIIEVISIRMAAHKISATNLGKIGERLILFGNH